jgi:hypothetical protein
LGVVNEPISAMRITPGKRLAWRVNCKTPSSRKLRNGGIGGGVSRNLSSM